MAHTSRRASPMSLSIPSAKTVSEASCLTLCYQSGQTDPQRGKKTPLEGLSHLADRSVAIVGAFARTATVVGATAAGTAVGTYLGNPALGRVVGQQVGQVIAPTVGNYVEEGIRKLVPHAKRKLAGFKKSAGKILKKVKIFALGG